MCGNGGNVADGTEGYLDNAALKAVGKPSPDNTMLVGTNLPKTASFGHCFLSV